MSLVWPQRRGPCYPYNIEGAGLRAANKNNLTIVYIVDLIFIVVVTPSAGEGRVDCIIFFLLVCHSWRVDVTFTDSQC